MTAVAAAERTMIVLDGSGSMWGQIDGRPKLEIARETLRSILPTIPADNELGLIAYGHREKGNCADIELIVPAAPGTAQAISDAADALRFLGKTPLTDAVRQAAEPPPAPVDLPAATVAGPDTVAIGSTFKVDWTGPGDKGDYVDIVAADVEAIGSENSYAYAETGNPARLRAPGKLGDYQVRYIWEGPDKRHVLAAASLAVVDSEVALIAPPTVGAGQSFTVEWKGPDAAGDYLDIVPDGHTDVQGELAYAYTSGGNPATIRAPGAAATYTLRYVLEAPDGRKVLASVPLAVSEAKATLAFPPAATGGDRLSVFWTGPAGAGDYLDLVPAGYADLTGEIAYFYIDASPDGETGTLDVPGKSGDYLVRYVMEASDGRRLLAQQPLRVETATASLQAPDSAAAGGKIDIVWTGPDSPGDYLDLVPAGGTETNGELAYAYTDRAGGDDRKVSTMPMPKAPGDYDLRYVLQTSDGRHVLARRPIRVE